MLAKLEALVKSLPKCLIIDPSATVVIAWISGVVILGSQDGTGAAIALGILGGAGGGAIMAFMRKR